MLNGKNHVGRPSNEELKRRRNKKIILFVVPFVVIFLIIAVFFTDILSNLMGNSVVSYYCYDNSYTLNGTKCEKVIKEKPIILGDLDSDEKITENDLKVLREYVDLLFEDENYEFTEEQVLRADIDGDNEIFEKDYTIFQGYLEKGNNRFDTYNSYYAEIGIKKLCKYDYKLENDMCQKKIVEDAKKQDVNSVSQKDLDDNQNQQVDYFQINYNANGGTGSMNNQKIIYGKSAKLLKNNFTKSNSIFSGWKILNNTRSLKLGTEQWACYKNSEKTEKGYASKDICDKYGYQIYNDEQIVSETANKGEVITMYAQWKEENYFTVKYNANGGIGVMPDQRIEFGIETKLNPNKFTSNKAFAGFRVYNNTRKKWACYKNTNKSDQGYVTNDYCNKYGYVIYDDNQVVSKTANPGEIVTMYAQWKEGNYFTVKYNANGGTGVMSNQNVEYGKKTKLLRNTFTNNGKLIRGWKIYNNSTNLWACYKNANKTDYGYATKDVCEKYGYQIYDNMQTISKTANKGEVITMYASWIDLKKYFDVPAVEEFATLELSTKGLYRQKVIQDIYVNNSDIYVSQDNFGKNPSISKDSTPSELIITKISRKNHSMQEIFREKKCGHGFFTIPSGVLMTTCDVDTPYDKDAHGHKAYKITSKGKRVFLADAFQNKRESFKIDYNNNIYMARINDGTQRFKFYKYNKDSKTVGSYIRTLYIKDTPYDMQGYALDGNYLYIYYGEGIDSGSNRLKYSVAYIDVYNANTGKLIKKNRIFKSNDTYMEAEGLDYLGDSIYIGVATTDEYDSAYGDIKYANVYRIKKKDLIN